MTTGLATARTWWYRWREAKQATVMLLICAPKGVLYMITSLVYGHGVQTIIVYVLPNYIL